MQKNIAHLIKHANFQFKEGYPAVFSWKNRLLLTNIYQFERIHRTSLIKAEKVLNTPITKFCNDDDINVIGAELMAY